MTAERHEVLIPVDAGRVVLAADYMLPDGDGPFPVALSMYPYRKDDVVGSLFLAPRITLAEDGIATLLVDMRGHGASTGEPGVTYDLGGTEGKDTAEVVEWAATQPWCTGDVGIWGVSYGGMTALAGAARRPPHLRAIFAVYASDDTHRDWVAPGDGCPMAFGNYSWSSRMFGHDLCPPSRQDSDGRWRQVWQERLDRMRTQPGHAFEWRQHAEDTDYWRGRVVDVSNITVPTFMVEGWHDFFADGAIRTFSQLNCKKRMVLGPWLHVIPDLVDREPYDWVGEMSAWFAHYFGLKAENPGQGRLEPASAETDSGADSSVLLFVGGSQVWRRYETWPPPEAEVVQMHLHADGRLDRAPSSELGEIHYSPTEVTGLEAGMLDPLGIGFGHPGDQHTDDLASLCFETAALKEPLELAGCPEALLALQGVETPDLRLTVKFCDVADDGFSELLTTGWLRVSEQLHGGSSATVSVHAGPVAAVLATGHRLRVSVSSTDFPRAWPTPGSAGFSLSLGGTNGSNVVLPLVLDVAAGKDVTTEVPRPPAVPRPDWVSSGSAVYRRTREDPNGVVEAVILNHIQLAPPSRALIELDERFTARIAATDLTTARVCADVTIKLDLADGEKVQVHVDTEFSDSSSQATGSVIVDGKTIFDQHWKS